MNRLNRIVLGVVVVLAAQANGGEQTVETRTGAPRFTLDKAILTALQQNPDILRAKQEIERTKGVIIEIRAQALPHITPSGSFQWIDPNLRGGSSLATGGGGFTFPGESDVSYAIRVTGTQLIF